MNSETKPKTSDFGVVFLAFSVVFDGHGSL
jgi:hypothetical protein